MGKWRLCNLRIYTNPRAESKRATIRWVPNLQGTTLDLHARRWQTFSRRDEEIAQMGQRRNSSIVPETQIERAILLIRGRKIILDAELARLYGAPTKALNQAVKRNAARFPEDFAFRLTAEEFAALASFGIGGSSSNRSQSVTGSQKHRNPRFLPFAFTEHGAIMAANVLNSNRAVEMSVHIVRTFVRLREAIVQNERLAHRLLEIERKVARHDVHLAGIVRALREMAGSSAPPKTRRIGFAVTEPEKR